MTNRQNQINACPAKSNSKMRRHTAVETVRCDQPTVVLEQTHRTLSQPSSPAEVRPIVDNCSALKRPMFSTMSQQTLQSRGRNIQVIVRVRPLNRREVEEGDFDRLMS